VEVLPLLHALVRALLLLEIVLAMASQVEREVGKEVGRGVGKEVGKEVGRGEGRMGEVEAGYMLWAVHPLLCVLKCLHPPSPPALRRMMKWLSLMCYRLLQVTEERGGQN